MSSDGYISPYQLALSFMVAISKDSTINLAPLTPYPALV